MTETTDQQLVQRIGKGDHQAFAELVKRHTDRFYQLAFYTLKNKSDADDVIQTVFIKLWQSPQKWNVKKSQFTTWFYRVVLNACHDLIRKQNNYQQLETNIKVAHEQDNIAYLSRQTVGGEEERLSDNQQQAYRQQSLEYAIAQLPQAQRDAINLVVYTGLPQKQTAEILSITVKALESLLFRAKKNISNFAKQYLDELESVPLTPVNSQLKVKAYEKY